jgi:proline dehydrogenase
LSAPESEPPQINTFPSASDAPSMHSQNYDHGLMERLLFKVAKKWVAGYNISDAIAAAHNSNESGMSAILNFLGEDTTSEQIVNETVKEYSNLMDLMHTQRIDGCISVKPTQVGLAIDYDLCLHNFRELAKKAKSLNMFLWFDMESVKFTEDTISIYLDVFNDYKEIGIALQAYLKRSASDLLHILEEPGGGGKVRLVKGAYHESEEHAFTSREDINRNYSKLMQMLFEGAGFFAIATHDSELVEEAIKLSDKRKKAEASNAEFEFQFLMGIRDELKQSLVARNFKVSEYIPYGSQWLPYSVRRIRERKRNLLLLARSLV